MKSRIIETKGIKMHLLEQGEGFGEIGCDVHLLGI